MKSSPCGPDTLPLFFVVKRACNVALTKGCLTNTALDASATIEQKRLGKENQVPELQKQHSVSGNNQLLLMLPMAVKIPLLLQHNFGGGKFV